jgi:Holliday junction DNA helicase RuvA
MIAKLSGRLDTAGADHVVIDVGGVGYLVFCSARTLARLGNPGGTVSVLVETHVREDHIHLYGFADAGERDWFRTLITVQGVGARVALAVLGVLEPEALVRAIAAQDRAAVSRADGVGPKLATRILTELKDKAGALVLGAAAGKAAAGGPAPATAGTAEADAVSALVNLGYGRGEAFGAVITAARTLGQDAEVSALIRAGLRELSGQNDGQAGGKR